MQCAPDLIRNPVQVIVNGRFPLLSGFVFLVAEIVRCIYAKTLVVEGNNTIHMLAAVITLIVKVATGPENVVAGCLYQ